MIPSSYRFSAPLALALVLAGCVGPSATLPPAGKLSTAEATTDAEPAAATDNASAENQTGTFPVLIDDKLNTTVSVCAGADDTEVCLPWIPNDMKGWIELPLRNVTHGQLSLSWTPSSPTTETLWFVIFRKDMSTGEAEWSSFCGTKGPPPLPLDCELEPIGGAESYVLGVVPRPLAPDATQKAYVWIVTEQPYHVEGTLTTIIEPSAETI